MGDRVRVRLPEAALYFGMQPTIQVDSAFYHPWDGKMSTSQRAVMLCGWGVKAARHGVFAGKTVCIRGALRNALYLWTYTLLQLPAEPHAAEQS